MRFIARSIFWMAAGIFVGTAAGLADGDGMLPTIVYSVTGLKAGPTSPPDIDPAAVFEADESVTEADTFDEKEGVRRALAQCNQAVVRIRRNRVAVTRDKAARERQARRLGFILSRTPAQEISFGDQKFARHHLEFALKQNEFVAAADDLEAVELTRDMARERARQAELRGKLTRISANEARTLLADVPTPVLEAADEFNVPLAVELTEDPIFGLPVAAENAD